MASTAFSNLLFLNLFLSTFGSGIEGRWVQGTSKLHVNNFQNRSTNLHVDISEKLVTNISLSKENDYKRRFLLERFWMRGVWNTSTTYIQPTVNSKFHNHWAGLVLHGGEYYGAKATLNVWGLPGVGANQGSAALIWVIGGLNSSPNNFNVIKAGWHVLPEVYGDQDTYFFVSWTTDSNYNTGCYNFECKGFVLDSTTRYVPGNRLRPLSIYNGQQYYLTLKISKDMETGDWWLHAGPYGDKPVGYWPKSLFTSLAGSASAIQWGGVVGYHQNEKSPPMGSGHFPSEGEGKAASLKNIQVISKDGEIYTPKFTEENQDRKDCYQIGGEVTLFGGPGGCN